MSHRSSVPSAPSGTSWGSPRRTRCMRATARLCAVSMMAAVGVSMWALPSQAAQASPSPYDPAVDPYSMANTTALMGATTWWDNGYTGAGVDVAMIDTGISPVEGLATAGKIVYGPDLSLESQ